MKDLLKMKVVPFDSLYLDPNNPRIAPEDPPGYDDPARIADPAMQTRLEERIHEVYDVKELVSAIRNQGWVPIDAILVWENPAAPGQHIVVEGNTRTVALRQIRGELTREQAKLAKMQKSGGFAARDVEGQREEVAALEAIIAETHSIEVYPVNAANPEELEAKLPRLLGVRHITHAKQWSPYAQNLYILSLYDREFRGKHGSKTALSLDRELVRRVGDRVSLGETKTRRNIQAASAFSHFKRQFADRLPAGDQFSDDDQYFFDLILQHRYAQDQFQFGKDDLQLSDEPAEVLFKWAFEQKRSGRRENPNKWYKAENIRVWSAMRAYDDANGTGFASRFNVDQPDEAPQMDVLEAEYLAHKARLSPVNALADLLDTMRKLEVQNLMYQRNHIQPMIEDIVKLGQGYLAMMDALKDD